MASKNLRAYRKPAGSNPEIRSSYYELVSQEVSIHGIWNGKVLNLKFELGVRMKDIVLLPIALDEPVVLAVENVTAGGCFFFVIDAHLSSSDGAAGKMMTFKPFKTSEYIVDTDDGRWFYDIGVRSRKPYWAIKTEGDTYCYGQQFSGTWQLDSADSLCAFIAGKLTAGELRIKASPQLRTEVFRRSPGSLIEDFIANLQLIHRMAASIHRDNLELLEAGAIGEASDEQLSTACAALAAAHQEQLNAHNALLGRLASPTRVLVHE